MDKKTTFLIFRGIALVIDLMISAFVAITAGDLIYCEDSSNRFYLVMVIGCLLMLFRDIFGKSLGKFFLGLEIVDEQSGTKATISQRILKNITAPITVVVEAPIVIFSKDNRRLGDRLAKTKTQIADNNSLYLYLSSPRK